MTGRLTLLLSTRVWQGEWELLEAMAYLMDRYPLRYRWDIEAKNVTARGYEYLQVKFYEVKKIK